MTAMLAEAPPMAERLTQRQTCRNHRPFKNYEAALKHYVAQVSAGETDPGQHVYACGACGQWHHGGSQVRSLGRLLTEAGWEDGHGLD